MRLVAASLLFAALSCGGANASSFLVIGGEAPAATPSIEVLGAAPAKVSSIETLGTGTVASISILALGEPLPDVAMEKVAAIPQPSSHPRSANAMPLVIRGGLMGDAAPAATSAPAAETAAPEPAQASAEPPPPKRHKTPPRPRQPDIVKPPEEENATPLPQTQ